MQDTLPDDIYYAVAHRSQAEIDSFKTRYEDFDASLIPLIFNKSLDLEATNWKQSSSWGSAHVIYYVDIKGQSEPLILRANTGFNPRPEAIMKIEGLITDKVLAAGVPANKILHTDISRKLVPFDFQIEETLIGQDLEDNFNGTQADYDAMSFALGRFIATYHGIKLPKFGRFDAVAAEHGELKGAKDTFFDYVTLCLDSDISYLVDAEVINSNVGIQIRELFNTNKDIINISQGVLLHHDLADHNLMFKDNKLTAIFDWEAAVVGDPVLDLASCPTWRTHYPREEQLVAGYKSVTALPENFEAKMNIYRLRTMLWKMVFAIRADILNDERIARFKNSLKPYGLDN
jgi:aminoglycoside phosphotransferase (APT) family kinase protein